MVTCFVFVMYFKTNRLRKIAELDSPRFTFMAEKVSVAGEDSSGMVINSLKEQQIMLVNEGNATSTKT